MTLSFQDERRTKLVQLLATPGCGFLGLELGQRLLDYRLQETGFRRHPLQHVTPADGSCGYWGVAVQLVDAGSTSPGVPGLTKHEVEDFRKDVVNSLPEALEDGWLDWSGWEEQYTRGEWMANMHKTGTFADEVALQLFAKMFSRDIIILPTFPQSAWDGVCRRILGGRIDPETNEEMSSRKG